MYLYLESSFIGGLISIHNCDPNNPFVPFGTLQRMAFRLFASFLKPLTYEVGCSNPAFSTRVLNPKPWQVTGEVVHLLQFIHNRSKSTVAISPRYLVKEQSNKRWYKTDSAPSSSFLMWETGC